MKVLKSLLLLFFLALSLTSTASASLTTATFSATITRFSPDIPERFAGASTIPSVDTNVAKTPQISHRIPIRHSVAELNGNGDYPVFSDTAFRELTTFPSKKITSYRTVSAAVPRQNSASSSAPRAPPL